MNFVIVDLVELEIKKGISVDTINLKFKKNDIENIENKQKSFFVNNNLIYRLQFHEELLNNIIKLQDNSLKSSNNIIKKTICKIILRHKEKTLNNYIRKNILKKENKLNSKNPEEFVYLLSKNIKEKHIKLIDGILYNLDIKKYKINTTIIKNIDKHVNKYINENKIKKKIQELKCLLVCNRYTYDETKLQILINTFKSVEIYSKDKVTLKNIEKISNFNNQEGTTISVLNNNIRKVTIYDVIIYDNIKIEDCLKLRTKDISLKLETSDIEEDVFNDKYEFMLNKMNNDAGYEHVKKEYENLKEKYGKIAISNCLLDVL